MTPPKEKAKPHIYVNPDPKFEQNIGQFPFLSPDQNNLLFKTYQNSPVSSITRQMFDTAAVYVEISKILIKKFNLFQLFKKQENDLIHRLKLLQKHKKYKKRRSTKLASHPYNKLIEKQVLDEIQKQHSDSADKYAALLKESIVFSEIFNRVYQTHYDNLNKKLAPIKTEFKDFLLYSASHITVDECIGGSIKKDMLYKLSGITNEKDRIKVTNILNYIRGTGIIDGAFKLSKTFIDAVKSISIDGIRKTSIDTINDIVNLASNAINSFTTIDFLASYFTPYVSHLENEIIKTSKKELVENIHKLAKDKMADSIVDTEIFTVTTSSFSKEFGMAGAIYQKATEFDVGDSQHINIEREIMKPSYVRVLYEDKFKHPDFRKNIPKSFEAILDKNKQEIKNVFQKTQDSLEETLREEISSAVENGLIGKGFVANYGEIEELQRADLRQILTHVQNFIEVAASKKEPGYQAPSAPPPPFNI